MSDVRSSRRPRPVLVGGLLWVLVVAAGSALVWVVISRAGQEVGSGAAVAPPPATASTSSPTARASRSPSVSPTPRASRSSPASPTAGRPTEDGATAPVRRTWSGAAGVVTVQCRGAAVSLVGAQPSADGYAVDVEDRGPERVEVELQQAGEDGAETRVRARCAGGSPVFDVELDD
jgi:cytoskeletal protein RodZ